MAQDYQSIGWLKQRLGDACKEVPVQGDQPLLLDDPSCAYATLSEHHQLFCVGYQQGRAVGRREHIALCKPGQVLFGLAPQTGPDATALVLSGVTGSIVWRIPTALLFELMKSADGKRIVGQLFDEWIELLVETLPTSLLPTKHQSLDAGESLQTDAVAPLSRYAVAPVSQYFQHADGPESSAARGRDFAVAARSGITWISPPQAPRAYRGIDLSQEPVKVECWPLTPSAWALCPEGPLRGWSTAELLEASGGPSFTDTFYAFVVSIASRRRARLASGRLERDAASREATRVVVGAAFGKLARVGSGRRLERQPVKAFSLDGALEIIAAHLDVPAPHVTAPRGGELGKLQTALARMTGLRARSVLLEGKWWAHDNGPLLGFIMAQDRGAPVALLSTPSGYMLHDPRAESPRRVTARVAQSLSPQAHQIYPPIPAKALRPLDLLRFAGQGAHRDVAFVVGVGMATGSLSTLIPLLTGQVFDSIIPGAERELLRDLTAVLLAVYLSLALFDLARGFVMVRAQTRMDTTLEAGVWDRLLSLPMSFFRKYSAGDLASRAAGIGAIREVLAGVGLSTILGGLFSLWNLGLLFYIDVRLAVAATLIVILAGTVAAIAAYVGLQRQRVVADLDGKIGGLLLQLFTGIAKLRVTCTESRAFAVWADLFARRRDADLGAERVNIQIGLFETVLPTLSSMTLFYLLAGTGSQALSTGQFLAFSAAFGSFLGAMLAVVQTVLQSLQVIPMYERAKPILEQASESFGRSEARTELQGGIEVSHASFRYSPDTPLVLDDVSIRIEPNEFVALVGASGSGKSTLLRLLLGFEECTEGGVFYDEQALSSLDLRQVRQQIGVVLQNGRVSAGDIYTNIVGNSGLTLEDAWRAARGAAMAEEIEKMPMGMHTVISQGGGTLSGGQRQRLLIARALAHSPKILYFDEATSALDNVTQSQVSTSLEALRVTRVVIAHRLSTIRQADKIIVIERGRVVEQGRYDELMKQGGVFKRLAERQTV